MKITITDYNSKYFPISISWNNGKNSNVFSCMDSVKQYCTRFNNPVFVDKRHNKQLFKAGDVVWIIKQDLLATITDVLTDTDGKYKYNLLGYGIYSQDELKIG